MMIFTKRYKHIKNAIAKAPIKEAIAMTLIL